LSSSLVISLSPDSSNASTMCVPRASPAVSANGPVGPRLNTSP